MILKVIIGLGKVSKVFLFCLYPLRTGCACVLHSASTNLRRRLLSRQQSFIRISIHSVTGITFV